MENIPHRLRVLADTLKTHNIYDIRVVYNHKSKQYEVKKLSIKGATTLIVGDFGIVGFYILGYCDGYSRKG